MDKSLANRFGECMMGTVNNTKGVSKMKRKQAYLKACMGQSVEWLKKSAANPNKFMTPMDIKIHFIAIRNKSGFAK